MLNVVFKPLRGTDMVDMIAIVQGNQHIDIEQRTHQTPSASRNRSISSLLMTAPREGKG